MVLGESWHWRRLGMGWSGAQPCREHVLFMERARGLSARHQVAQKTTGAEEGQANKDHLFVWSEDGFLPILE